jgi:hypothetical protein
MGACIPTLHSQPAAAVAKTKHNPGMQSQPAAVAAVAKTKHNPTLQLPYKALQLPYKDE